METLGGSSLREHRQCALLGLPPHPSCSSPKGLDLMCDDPPTVNVPSPTGRQCHSHRRVNVDRFYFQMLFRFLDETYRESCQSLE